MAKKKQTLSVQPGKVSITTTSPYGFPFKRTFSTIEEAVAHGEYSKSVLGCSFEVKNEAGAVLANG